METRAAFDYVVMSLFSKNLSELRRLSPVRHFTRATSLRIAAQMITAINDLHALGYLHRDIKVGQRVRSRIIAAVEHGYGTRADRDARVLLARLRFGASVQR
jgi:serine/threonine protein kinase